MKEQDKIFLENLLIHAGSLRRFALSLCRNEFDADDLVSETVIKAYENFKSLKNISKIKQWLFRILSNEYINCYRKRKFLVQSPVSNEKDEFSLFEALEKSTFVDDGSPEIEFINMLTREKIEKAISELTDEYRIVIELCDKEEFTYSEIAIILKVPVGTVRSRISRARTILQKKLWQQAEEIGIKPRKTRKKKKDGYVCTCGKEEELTEVKI